jgi:hypothetical protein
MLVVTMTKPTKLKTAKDVKERVVIVAGVY